MSSFAEYVLAGLSARLLVLDKNLTIIYANPAYYELRGLPPEEVIGKNVAEVFPATILEEAGLAESIRATLRDGQRVRWSGYRQATADHGERIIDIRLDPCPGLDHPPHVLLTIEDVTDRHRQIYQQNMLQQITQAMLGIVELPRLLHAILTGLTAGGAVGLGFNRAILLLIDEEEGASPAAVPTQVTKLSIQSGGEAELWVGTEELWCTGQIQAASGLGSMIWTEACDVPPPPELPPLDVEISFTYIVAGGQLTMVSQEPVGTAQGTVQITRMFVKLADGPPSAVVGEWFGAPYDQPPSEWDSREFMLLQIDGVGAIEATDYYMDGSDQQVAELQLGSCFGAEAGNHLLLELEMSPVELKHMYYVSDSPCSNLLTLEDPYVGESPVLALRHPALDPDLVGGWFVLAEGTEMYINPDGTYSIEFLGEVIESGTIASYYACGPSDDFDGWVVFHPDLSPGGVVVGPVPVLYWGYELGPGIVTLHGFYLGSPHVITLSPIAALT